MASCQTFNLNKAGYVWRLSMLDSLGAVPECGSYPTLFTSCPCVSSSDHRMCSNCKYFTLLRVKITCALWVWYVSCRRSPAFGLVLHRPWSELVDNTEYTVFGEEFRILLIVALVSGIWTGPQEYAEMQKAVGHTTHLWSVSVLPADIHSALTWPWGEWGLSFWVWRQCHCVAKQDNHTNTCLIVVCEVLFS